jgi:TadE-like protein
MKKFRRYEGQTLIETALILFLLMLIVLGISEFSRAWFVKNSLKNAVRQGVRVAVVTPRNNLPATFNCINPSCPVANPVTNAVCCQPGIPKKAANNTVVTLTCKNQSGTVIACNTITANGSVDVNATSTFFFIIGSNSSNSLWPWPQSTNMSANASMRYEL